MFFLERYKNILRGCVRYYSDDVKKMNVERLF